MVCWRTASTFIEKYSKKKSKNTRMDSHSLFHTTRFWPKLGRQLAQVHLASASLSFCERDTRITNDFFLQTALRSVSVRRYVSVDAEFPARTAAGSLASFPRAKFRQVLPSRALRRTSTCTMLAVETYCTVCMNVWSFATIHLAHTRNASRECLRNNASTRIDVSSPIIGDYHIQDTECIFESNFFFYFRSQFSLYNIYFDILHSQISFFF